MTITHREGGKTVENNIWRGMVNRCTNPKNRGYAKYGGAGITVCDRWRQYENFLADMGRRPTPQHSLDRIDGTQGYRPGNVRWATKQEQGRNRLTLKPLTIDGVSRLLCEWAEISGIDTKMIWQRLRDGWTPSEAVFSPVQLLRPLKCQHGHPLVGPTMRWEGRSRRCKICKKAYDHAYRLRKGAA